MEKKVYVTIKDCSQEYYLMKIERRDFDVYCFIPDLGFHHSRHESGESHFHNENKEINPLKQPPIWIMMGEAGIIEGKSVICNTLVDLGHASGICSVCYLITSLNHDYRKFNRNPKNCFTIDKTLLPDNAEAIIVNVWAVPKRNRDSFNWNNPNIREELLYRVTDCEPQIWVYANPA
jgi:hypothetical protein